MKMLLLLAVLLSLSGSAYTSVGVLTREAVERDLVQTLLDHPAFAEMAKNAKMDVKVFSLAEQTELSSANFTTEIELPRQADLAGRFPFTVVINSEGFPQRKLRAAAQVSLFREVLFARRLLRKGEQLSAENTSFKLVDISQTMRRGYFADALDLRGLQVKRTIPAETLLTPDIVEKAAVARKGEGVTLVVQTGGLLVRCRGVLQQDARLDETVQVQNIESQKIVMGRMVSRDSVLVQW